MSRFPQIDQEICWDRGRPRPQRAAGAQVLNRLSSFRAARSFAGEGARSPSKSFDWYFF